MIHKGVEASCLASNRLIWELTRTPMAIHAANISKTPKNASNIQTCVVPSWVCTDFLLHELLSSLFPHKLCEGGQHIYSNFCLELPFRFFPPSPPVSIGKRHYW